MRLADAWPLFDLRIRSERLELRLPTDDELVALLAVAQAGIHPADEMPFGVAWTDAPSPAFERGFMQFHWHQRASWSADSWNLALATFRDGLPIGAQDIHGARFRTLRHVGTGSWLGREFQGAGVGKEMRAAVLAFAFDHLGAEVAETECFVDNMPSQGVSRALGYRDNGRGRLAPRGTARETLRFRMTREDWRARARPPIEVEGLEACRDLFGLAAGQ